MMAQTNIMVTGATGFVGQALLKHLLKSGAHNVTAALRACTVFDYCSTHIVCDLSNTTDWSEALTNQQVVIRAAAHAHILKGKGSDPLAQYRRVNVDGTVKLARQAAAVGVERFIFVSSIKVNGEQTTLGKPFTA